MTKLVTTYKIIIIQQINDEKARVLQIRSGGRVNKQSITYAVHCIYEMKWKVTQLAQFSQRDNGSSR